MAYLHCHTKFCGWSQDDFWDWSFGRHGYFSFGFISMGYNPVSLWLSYIFGQSGNLKSRWNNGYIRPRILHGNRNERTHSWVAAIQVTRKLVRSLFRQRWWTWESWKRARTTAVCPKCGQRNFDID